MDHRMAVLQEAISKGSWLAIQSVRLLDNWPQALAALCDDIRGRAPESALVLKFIDGLELEMMPGGIGGYLYLFPEIFCQRVYEPPEFTFGDSPLIVDIGANAGFFSCKMAKQFPGGRVFAIEVMPQYCELIRKNAGRNQLRNLTVVQAAIGDGKTNAEIRYWFTEAGYLKVTALVPSHVNAETLTVPSLALQHAFDDNHIQACDLLKVDIEGHEYAMFSAAAPACLRRCRQIAMEWHRTGPEGGPRQLAEQLRSAGFQILPATTLEGDMGFLYALRKD